MSDSTEGCMLMGIMWGMTIGLSIGSGLLAWNYIEPESFLGTIGFIVFWGVLSKIGHFISTLIAVGIVAIFNQE